MNVENTSTESVTDIKVEIESDDEVESELDLYADHVIKEEMVIGPVVLQVVDATYSPEDVPLPKKPKLETTDEETDQVKPEKGMKEDNIERIISNVDFKKNLSTNTALRNNKQTNYSELRKCNQTPVISENLFICKECGKTFPTKYKLRQHFRWHEKKFPRSYRHTDNICSYCKFTCRYKSSLTSHLRIHTGEKPYSCSHCDYKCNQKGTLSVHLRTHTGEKRYSCDHCGHKCSRKSNLAKHLRIHTREKTYSCSRCDYKCNHRSSLTKHLRYHTDEKKNV